MKNKGIIIFTLLLIAFFLQSNGQTASSSNASADDKYQVVKLTQAEFENKIFNPLKDGDSAVYKGKKPCIVDFMQIGADHAKCYLPSWKNYIENIREKSLFTKLMLMSKKHWQVNMASVQYQHFSSFR